MIGLLYQAPLAAIIGDEGNGYYSLAYNIYTIVLLISSYSIPSAISKIMAERIALGEYRNVQRIFRVSLYYVLIVGSVAGLLLFFGAPVLVSGSSIPVLRVFAPTVFIFGILGVLRGYYQAHSSMIQTSISQIIEQILNAGMSLFMAWLLMRQAANQDATTKAVYGASGSALGTGSGVLGALIFMLIVYYLSLPKIRKRVRLDTTETEESYGAIFREVIRVVTPFILSSFVMNLTTAMNQTIFTRVMMGVRGYEEVTTTMQYGIFSRKAVVITNIPISIATATSAAIIPHISSAFATGSRRETTRRARQAVWLTSLIAVPCTMALLFLAKPVTMVLFPQMESLEEASRLLMILSVTVFFYSISTVTNAVLQAVEHMNLPLVSAAIALVIQTAVLVLLLVKTDLDVYALVIASIVYSILIFIANEIFLRKYLGRHALLGMRRLSKPLISSLAMGVGAFGTYEILITIMSGAFHFGESGAPVKELYFANLIAFLAAAVVAVFLYAFVLVKSGAVTENDLLSMPKGEKILGWLKKMRWM